MNTPSDNWSREGRMLGACMVDPAVMQSAWSRNIPTAYFRTPQDAGVWRGMAALKQKDLPVTPQHVADMLSKRGELDMVGGAEYLGELVERAFDEAEAQKVIEELAGKNAQGGLK